MNEKLRNDAEMIISASIQAVLPDAAVIRALERKKFPSRVFLVAAGKAAWQMAVTAADVLGDTLTAGVVVTKYGHLKGSIPRCQCYEGGHPVPDDNSFRGTQAVLELTKSLNADDTVLFLLSGGGSALFEKPMISGEELQYITDRLLAAGADIVEINTVRKRLSHVKGGRFAQWCCPAKVYSVVLSDIIGDPLDMIASGPACPDTSTCAQALAAVSKYQIALSSTARSCLKKETPRELKNTATVITGSVRELCSAACDKCAALGYFPILLTDRLCCEAREAGSFLSSILRTHAADQKQLAFIAGGETIVRLTGHGLGGRNQELALSAASGIDGISDAAVFSVGSDGTDGPTDAAGGYVDGDTAALLRAKGIDPQLALAENDSYHALEACGGLIVTGPTGTNVNDVAVGLLMLR